MKILMFFLLIIIKFYAYSQKPIKIWGKNPDDYHKNKTKLFVYQPESYKNSKTAIIFMPGGSYCYLSKQYEGHIPAKYFSKNIYTFVLYYRRGIHGNRFPAMIEDIQKAIYYVKQNYGIDTVGVCGFSAGGHLAGCAAFFYDKNFINLPDTIDKKILRPDFSVMCYPVVSMSRDFSHKKSRRNLLGQYRTAEMEKNLSLEQNVNPNSPPIYLLDCEDDPIVDYHNSLALDSALTEKGVPHFFDFNKYGGHGFGISPQKIKNPDKTAASWPERLENWLINFGIKIN